MIVQDFPDHYVMIAQHDHAAISGTVAAKWKQHLLRGHDKRSSMEHAVTNHDIGWKLIDAAPFWNGETKAPYTFIDFPTAPKTMLYKYGIEEVARNDNYAALLCSRHYTRFLQNNLSSVAQNFVHEEKLRQENLIQSIADFDKANFDFHYGVLQMLDDISLFICLNEPGVHRADSHPFFKNGIKRSENIDTIADETIQVDWQDEQTVSLEPFIFDDTFTVILKQQKVAKRAIEQEGLLKSYQHAPTETLDITLAPA